MVLQLRGTERELATFADSDDVRVDLKVAELLQAERFAIPVLLMRVPVNDADERFYFLWLQEYVNVVLDAADEVGESWREQTWKSVRIPAENVSSNPEFTSRLREIAAEPIRVKAVGELALVGHEMRWAEADPARLLELFDVTLSIRGLSYPPGSPWASLDSSAGSSSGSVRRLVSPFR